MKKADNHFSSFIILQLSLLIVFSYASVLVAATPDTFEPDNSYDEAKVIIVEPYEIFHPHTFHAFFDEDWVQFEGKQHTEYQVQVIEPSADCDPVIEIFASDGTSLMVKRNDNGPGGSEFIYWRCSEDGTYFVRVANNSAYFGSDIEYKLSVSAPDEGPVFPGYVTGKVFSGSIALAGAILTAGNGVGISLSDGSYLLSVKEGTVTVNVRKDGYYPSDFTVTVAANQTVQRNVELVKIPTPSKPPTISGNPKTSVSSNHKYSFIPTASDPDGDNISFSIINKPYWAHFNPDNGILAGIPGATDIGIYDSIVITVTDSQGEYASLPPFTLEVKSPKAYPAMYLLLNERL